ncbi:MAG: T9SS type A sorting domain-containing protein [Bacteroidota bacterium]
MKKILMLCIAFCVLQCTIGQGFSKAEYFFDADPGIGSGIALQQTGTSDTLNFNASISTTGLLPGFHFLVMRMFTKTNQPGLAEKRGFYISASSSDAANINAAEYFFDTDPGSGNGLPLAVSAGATVNFTTPIPQSLTNGFHFLAIRTRGTDGVWGMFEKRGFYITSGSADAANINAAEYFFDTDPGQGNGLPIAVSAGAVVNFTTPIPQSLPNGFHFLAIRTRGTDGVWGLFEKRGFYITSGSADAANINAAEYFFDTDPGQGNGLPIAVSAGAVVNFTTPIPQSLPNGFHFLAIRTRGTDGVWGLFEKRGFYITSGSSDATNINAAEYFFDADPGVGNGLPLTVSAGAVVNFTAPIPQTLTPGFHFLSIRTRGTDGIWGLFEKRGFYVSTLSADLPNIVAMEYFFDADPGIGNGQPLTVTTPGAVVNQIYDIPVPMSLPDGQHFLAIRARNSNGTWGLYALDTLVVDISLPVTGLSLSGKRNGEKIELSWYTLTESNTSHYEIERSKNGIDFSKAGQVTAVGNSVQRNDYIFPDLLPLAGLNYYRIKQVDKDGRFVYSPVVLVLFSNGKPSITVFPNPVKDVMRFSWPVNSGKLMMQVYNQAGQLVKSSVVTANSVVEVNVSQLAAGKYHIRISDGSQLHQTSFEKL